MQDNKNIVARWFKEFWELDQARPGGPLPGGWNNMSGSSETGR